MKLYKTPGIFKKMYPDFLWNIPCEEQTIYLTFDDGPTPQITNWVLDLLNQYNAKATFFLIGKNIVSNPTLLDRIKKEGHVIGNHTFDHLKGRSTASKEYLDNFNKCQELVDSNLFRPPYGSLKSKQAKLIKPNAKVVMWDVLAYDWDQNLETDLAIEKIKTATQPGSIIVFHDTKKAEKNLKIMLPILLEFWTKKNFGFQKIPI
jgi:peptidoglycan/xylan/chitin deacetylase (PgdA/CDA1 family)